MVWQDILAAFTLRDPIAVAVLLVCWIFASWITENPPKSRPSTSVLMAHYRREWMVAFVTRDPRIFDAMIVSSLRQGAAFFASASTIAIGGGFALLGNAERLRGLAEDLTQSSAPTVVWEIKLILMLVFASNAFLKFVWSHRLFGYVSVLMAAVPNDPEDPTAFPRARKAGEINVAAARSYNRGLRSVYFGIAAGAWLAGAVPLIVAAVATLGVVLRREFASQSREVLRDPCDAMPACPPMTPFARKDP